MRTMTLVVLLGGFFGCAMEGEAEYDLAEGAASGENCDEVAAEAFAEAYSWCLEFGGTEDECTRWAHPARREAHVDCLLRADARARRSEQSGAGSNPDVRSDDGNPPSEQDQW